MIIGPNSMAIISGTAINIAIKMHQEPITAVDFDDDGPPPWSPTFRATAAANSRTSANASSPYRHVPACDDLRRRSNWRHQILFSGHGRDACGHFGIRGTLSERTGLIRFIKTYYVPPHGQEPPQALSNDMNGNGNTAMSGASVTNQTAWSEGYDGRDPLKRTPGQWVFPKDSAEDEFDGNGDDKVENNGDSNRRSGTEEDDYFADNDTPNSEETDDFWDVDTFGWCYRGYLDDGGEDGGLVDSNDGNCRAMNGCEDRKRATKQSPVFPVNDNGHGDGGGDGDDTLPVGGVGILGKWCDMHGGGPFWLFHRDLYDDFD
ncbi:hypothetical protein BGW42_001911 [Actinomortierella wolfii]|nr:hypothetical protein BGW42_001911 [Actinomortierella wolfii]